MLAVKIPEKVASHRGGDTSFQAAKVRDPIPIRSRLVRDALIQAAIDPEISEILGPNSDNDAFDFRVIHNGVDERVRVCACDDPEIQNPQDSGYIVLREVEIRREPRLTDARLVWSCRRRWVPPGDRIRIQYALSENGAMPLIEISQLATGSPDAIAAVLALICQDILEIDLGESGLAPETLVRRRRRPL
jgi:hypothetical protein